MVLVPRRLTVARSARGLSKADVGERLGVSRNYIYALETGRKTPSVDVQAQLAEAVGVQAPFLSRPWVEGVGSGRVHYRATKRTRVFQQEQATAIGCLAELLVLDIASRMKLPPVRLWEVDVNHCAPGDAARRVRGALGLGTGPLSNVSRLLEHLGVWVVPLEGLADGVDAFSWRGAKVPMAIASERRGTPTRRRFSLCHELGHLLLHSQRKPLALKAQADGLEDEADGFATELLLPESSMRTEFPRMERSLDWRALRRMKARWGASLAALLYRGHRLGLLDERLYRRGFQHLTRQGWRTSEPDEPDMEQPELLQRALSYLLAHGTSLADLVEVVGAGDLFDLIAQRSGAALANVVELRLNRDL